MNATNARVGILAYGSLIKDPGVEIEPLIVERIQCLTPFPVEYARLSKSRGDGPTVVPHTTGNFVRAEVLVLSPNVSLPEAKNLLWRREARKEGTGRPYSGSSSPNSVQVMELRQVLGVSYVLYTDFPPAGKLPNPTVEVMANAAIGSVAKAPFGKDGISYLIQLSNSGIETALTADYGREILRRTGASTLLRALSWLQAPRAHDRAKQQLWAKSSAPRTPAGSCNCIEDNLISGVRREDFEADLRAGAGCELDGKFLAIHSSTALAVNSFAPFKRNVASLALLGNGYKHLQFEKRLPTGLKGTPPNLDVWLERDRSVVAVESKLLEYFEPKCSEFSASYERLAPPHCEECWWSVLQDTKAMPKRHLHVAQLVKHYLGLLNYVQAKPECTATLVYIFWEPTNWSEIAVCRQHRIEVEQLAERVSNSHVKFRWMTYAQLWEEWQTDPTLTQHVSALKTRYLISL